MLDFTRSKLPHAQLRCQRRAATAGKAARVMRVALIGMIGVALIAEPALVGAARNGMTTIHARLSGKPQPVIIRAGAFDLPVSVATMQIGDPVFGSGQVVAQNDVELLGDFDSSAPR